MTMRKGPRREVKLGRGASRRSGSEHWAWTGAKDRVDWTRIVPVCCHGLCMGELASSLGMKLG